MYLPPASSNPTQSDICTPIDPVGQGPAVSRWRGQSVSLIRGDAPKTKPWGYSADPVQQRRWNSALPPGLDAGAQEGQKVLALLPTSMHDRQHALHEPAALRAVCPRPREPGPAFPRSPCRSTTCRHPIRPTAGDHGSARDRVPAWAFHSRCVFNGGISRSQARTRRSRPTSRSTSSGRWKVKTSRLRASGSRWLVKWVTAPVDS
jgi:hypothetical protein